MLPEPFTACSFTTSIAVTECSKCSDQREWKFDNAFRARMDTGRRLHREQISELFAPQLAERPAAEREALLDLLVVATDVYTWKLLRRDRGLDRPTAEARVRLLIAGILTDHRKGG